MTMMVCFRSGLVDYCMPVRATRAVRLASGMIPLPAARPNTAGIIAGDPPLTVIAPFAADGAQILIVEADENRFGLLVDVVTGLRQISDSQINCSPRGQDRKLVSGTTTVDGRLILVTDPDALAGQL